MSDVRELVRAALEEAQAKHDREARCPGCNAPTQIVKVCRGVGADRWYEEAPAWCHDCLNAKIRKARAGACSCSDPTHEHVA